MSDNKLRNRILLEEYFKTGNPVILEKLPYKVPLWHVSMLKDRARLDFYNQMIRDTVKDKIVLDIGTGSGILSHLAIKHGARKVYSIEMLPAFQDIYSVLMENPIKKGVAKLIEKNAIEVSIGELDGHIPDVVIHEIFGSDAFSENIVGVFQALMDNKIISHETKFLPGKFRLMAEGIKSDSIFENDYSVEDYEGYSLSKLEGLIANDHRFLQFQNTQKLKLTKTGVPQILYESTLPIFPPLDDLVFKLVDKTGPTYIRTWMILEMGDHKLETHHDVNDSHWANSIFKVPVSSSNNKEVRFKIKENKLLFT